MRALVSSVFAPVMARELALGSASVSAPGSVYVLASESVFVPVLESGLLGVPRLVSVFGSGFVFLRVLGSASPPVSDSFSLLVQESASPPVRTSASPPMLGYAVLG